MTELGIKLIDLHQDLAFSSAKYDVIHSSDQSNISALKKFDSCTVFSVLFPHIYTWNEKTTELSKNYGTPTQPSTPLIQLFLEQLKLYGYISRTENIKVVKNASDLDEPGLKFLLALEGTDVLTDPFDVYLLSDMGLRSIGLTWNYDTKFASSCMSKKDYGLTGYGEELVRLCNENNIIIDLAHSSKQTILDTCSITKKPVICSHGNSDTVMNHIRNLDDASIEAIIKTNGIIGITAIPPTLSHMPKIKDLVTHMEYIGNNFGWKHVGIGTDFLGIDSTPAGFDNINKISALSNLLNTHSDDVLWKNASHVLKKIMA